LTEEKIRRYIKGGMVKYFYRRVLNRGSQKGVKKLYFNLNKYITYKFFSHDNEQFTKAFRDLGLQKGDTLFFHSSYQFSNGHKGKPGDIIDCLLDIIGEDGNLLMMSMPYIGSTAEYLKLQPVFDVRRARAMTGIISEIFRRKPGVQRSLHPTHSVLAYGKKAQWLIEGHESCLTPCGEGTPFDKFLSLKGKVIHFDVPFQRGFTFIHYLEDHIKEKLSFPLYGEKPMPLKMIDFQGNARTMNSNIFSEQAGKLRNLVVFGKFLDKCGVMRNKKIGRTRLMMVNAEDAVICIEKIGEPGIFSGKSKKSNLFSPIKKPAVDSNRRQNPDQAPEKKSTDKFINSLK
jgi:aminoglycoside 3-N-acetyltransferase